MSSEYEAAIKSAIDERLSQHPINQNPLFSAFTALARLSGPDNESWILERLERYFPSGCIESILETITLAGGSPSGERILPFVRNTVTFALSEQWSNHDKSFLVTKALGSLFFNDSPGLAITLLKGEAAWFLKSHQFRSLLQMLVWERSPIVDAWLRELVGESNDLSVAVLECLAERALIRNDQPATLDVACRMAEATNLDPAGVARRGTTRLAAESETFRGQLFARAKDTQSIAEAAGWLKFISEIGGDDGGRTAFELAERFGEQLGVVSSIAPNKQEATSLAFHGWFYRLGGMRSSRALYYLPEIMAKLHAFATAPDPVMGVAAERALLWIERERILMGTPPIGPRPLPPRVKTKTEDSPWQLGLQYDQTAKTG